MKNYNTASSQLESRIFYVPVLVVIVLAMLVMLACNREEKKQHASMPPADTLGKEVNQKSRDTSAQKMVFPGGDNFQLGCTFVQDQAEILLEEYNRHSTREERLQQIIAELEQLDKEWKQMDCQQVFGFMIPEIPHLPRTGKAKQPAQGNPAEE